VSRRPRVRHHVNPLNFDADVEAPDWGEVFPDATRPLEVEVGFMHGRFLLDLAARHPERNFVGLEIRRPLVDEVERRVARRRLENVHVVYCNANASFPDLFAPGALAAVYVHFPDPWFKKRHRKRRVFTPEFLEVVASRLAPGGRLSFMTDYADYSGEVVALVEGSPALVNPHGPGRPAPAEPGRVQTHREAWHLGKGDAVHRYVWTRR